MRLYNNGSLHLKVKLFLLFCNASSLSAQMFDQGEKINGHDISRNVKTFDADRDGDLDVLSFPYLYTNNGKGKKEKVIEIDNPNKKHEDIAIMDLNGDNNKDIVVLYENSEIEIFINEKKGFIKKLQKDNVSYHPSEYAKLYLYDANSDGIRDIIISGLLGKPRAYVGDNYQQYTLFKPFTEQFPKPHFISELDVNKDGVQELLVCNYSEESASLRAYAFKENNYKVIDSITLNPDGFRNPKLADIDGDGNQDLVYSAGYSEGAIYWIKRNSKGGFVALDTLVSQLDSEDFQLGDFDYDGDLDFAYITHINQYSYILWAENLGKNVFNKNHESLLPNIKESQTFFFEDFDGDKINDILFYYDNNEQIRPRYKIILQDKKGKIKEENTWMLSSKCSGVIINDLDSDGINEIVGYYNNELFYLSKGSNGEYSEAHELAISPFKIENLQCRDMNKDGKDDLIICSDDRENGKVGYFKNEGGMQFPHFVMVHDEKERLLNFEIIDFDLDGNKDLAVNYWKNDLRGIYIYKNIGNGTFSNKRITVTETNVTNSYPRLALFDVDQDGVEDILDYGRGYWFKYEDNQNWSDQTSPFIERFIQGIYKGHFDKNNVSDYIVSTAVHRLIRFKYNPEKKWQDSIIPLDFGITELCVGDINGDSFDDLVCLAETTELELEEGFHEDLVFSSKFSLVMLENDRSGNFVAKNISPIPQTNSIALGDIDNDGDLDIITACAIWEEGGIRVWTNTTKK